MPHRNSNPVVTLSDNIKIKYKKEVNLDCIYEDIKNKIVTVKRINKTVIEVHVMEGLNTWRKKGEIWREYVLEKIK